MTPKLVVWWNNCSAREPCPVCGEWTDQPTGPVLFFEDSARTVCDDCGERYAPELMLVLEVFRTAAWGEGRNITSRQSLVQAIKKRPGRGLEHTVPDELFDDAPVQHDGLEHTLSDELHDAPVLHDDRGPWD